MKMVFRIRTSFFSFSRSSSATNFMKQTPAIMALIFLCALLTSGQTVAPDTYLTGSVCDPNHASVHGAEITVTSTAFSRTVRTDDHGSFTIFLPHGDYVI